MAKYLVSFVEQTLYQVLVDAPTYEAAESIADHLVAQDAEEYSLGTDFFLQCIQKVKEECIKE